MARNLGIPVDVPVFVTPPPTTLESGRSGLAELLGRRLGIDAVFCSSDMMALGVLIEAQARGLAVPEQLAVMGLGDIGFAASVEPALTTVRIDGTRIGQTAAQYIVDRAEGRTIAEPILDIGFSIVERKSA
jgi:LacI family gluconate utilization system Gnt-I transcriptional repressor